MFLLYVRKDRSEKAKILNLEVSSFVMQKRVGQNVSYDALL
jgi:hypothetical protein